MTHRKTKPAALKNGSTSMANRSFSITHSQKQENGTMELMNFDFNDSSIRVIQIDGEPWFLASDVCTALTLGNVTDSTQNLGISEVQNYRVPGTRGRPNKIVSEAGLYKLTFRSTKTAAREFTDWVTGTVLPAIRKDGMYVQGEEKVATGELSDDELYMMTIERFKMKAERLQEEKNRLEHDHDRHLKFMSVSEYFSLRHIYPERGSSTSLAHRAKKICLREGITRNKQQRYLPVKDQVVEVFEYPAWVLDEAYDSLVDDRKILSDIPQQELRLVG